MVPAHTILILCEPEVGKDRWYAIQRDADVPLRSTEATLIYTVAIPRVDPRRATRAIPRPVNLYVSDAPLPVV